VAKNNIEHLEELHKEHGELVSNYKQCFTSPAGEQVLKDLDAAYGNRSSYSSNPYDTAYKEGQRSILLRIKSMIKERKED
tara:strand:+ start:606 stop:845 length:240 start_codon:yes stop_codon:yes gene_type:complete